MMLDVYSIDSIRGTWKSYSCLLIFRFSRINVIVPSKNVYVNLHSNFNSSDCRL